MMPEREITKEKARRAFLILFLKNTELALSNRKPESSWVPK
jgi:hypothetical protein